MLGQDRLVWNCISHNPLLLSEVTSIADAGVSRVGLTATNWISFSVILRPRPVPGLYRRRQSVVMTPPLLLSVGGRGRS
ncbi:hypothetical protein CRENBAI_004311 [Crenichthys baileyi]|uniref:Uncharacterized protein n=1 Tax=Crenichthys baileyi TaxID=28760 RepID=A0AAV9RNR0_9TELE